MVETEIKLPWRGTAREARERIETRGYTAGPRQLETDQVFDRGGGELRLADQLLRFRRSGEKLTVTYKGPSAPGRHKSREEIEFDVSDAEAFEEVLDRLGYSAQFRYQKYRTKFSAPDEPGIVTLDETPIGLFLELEGPEAWIDLSAQRLGFTPAEYCTASYSSLYKDYRRTHPGAPANMTFEEP